MTPWFTARERFNRTDPGWPGYISGSGLGQLDELLTLDTSLCPPIIKGPIPEDWAFVADFPVYGFFTDLDFLRSRLGGTMNYSLICAVRNPSDRPRLPDSLNIFEFAGYDLLEDDTTTSALTNCGGFPLAFDNSELSPGGLLLNYERAAQVRGELRAHYPEEPHADCDLWAVFIARSS
jgi:hypothetical protein